MFGFGVWFGMSSGGGVIAGALSVLEELERELDGVVEFAEEVRRELLSKAEESVFRIKEEVLRMVREEAEKAVAEAGEKAEREAEEILKKAEDEVEDVRKKMDEKLGKAVELCLNILLGRG